MLMPGIGGSFIGSFANRMNPCCFHEAMNSPSGAAIGWFQKVIKAVQSQSGIFFMQPYKFPDQSLITLCSAAVLSHKPGVIAAAGDFKDAA